MKITPNIQNPIYHELKKLKLISDKNLFKINNKTRDKKISVFKDKKEKIIFLEKFITDTDYYSSLKYKDNDRKNLKKTTKKFKYVRTMRGNIKMPLLDDALRRKNQFQKLLYNKDILDFGCGWAGFLRNLKNVKSLCGVELRDECIDFIKTNFKKINISNNINSFNKKFDVITLFHILEHIPNQVSTLKLLKSKLKPKGKIIVEVPHAEDFLILQDELKEFKDYTFFSEHLVLHTFKSLKKILTKAGFKKINIKFYPRYNFANHMGWFLKRKPGGHDFYNKIASASLDKAYKENLIRIGQTDTLIAVAENG
tara:strand:- start:2162 stop:3094 length:933 start_codon:yes stop_codon:yes gene_type:complete